MKLGTFNFNRPIFLAPMAGVTDIAYRILAHEMGCELVFGEMVSALGIHYRNAKTLEMLRSIPEERPIAIQIFGSDPARMSEAAQYIETLGAADIIDVNFGCPVPKVVKNGEGSALLKNPELGAKILETIKKTIKLPLTVKMRLGWDRDDSVELAKRFESAGVDAIAVHGRTREQYYSGKADWNAIANVKKSVTIPVIANGDIRSLEDLRKIQEITNADGFMIGRAAQGNPWIFRELIEERRINPTLTERAEMILKHLNLLIRFKGEKIGCMEMRRHATWYTRGLPFSSELREKFNRANSPDDFKNILNEKFSVDKEI